VVEVATPFISVDEEVGFVTACVNISGADLIRPVSVSVCTDDIDAIGTNLK
jgi:hypothetical protein